MNFDDYINRVDYPLEKNYVHLNRKGNRDSESIFDEEGYEKTKKAFLDEKVRIHEKFKSDLKDELKITGNPKSDLLIDKAWELSANELWELSRCTAVFKKVFSCAAQLVELIK